MRGNVNPEFNEFFDIVLTYTSSNFTRAFKCAARIRFTDSKKLFDNNPPLFCLKYMFMDEVNYAANSSYT